MGKINFIQTYNLKIEVFMLNSIKLVLYIGKKKSLYINNTKPLIYSRVAIN